MLRLLAALVVAPLASVAKERPVDPQPTDSFTAICGGPWMHADATAPYRGVVVEDNGSGRCCALSKASHGAFACVMDPGHQHGPVVESHLRFYDGRSASARLDLAVAAWPNPGMANPTVAPPYAELELEATSNGFLLRPVVASACTKPREEAKEVCRSAGRWIVDGAAAEVPRRAVKGT